MVCDRASCLAPTPSDSCHTEHVLIFAMIAASATRSSCIQNCKMPHRSCRERLSTETYVACVMYILYTYPLRKARHLNAFIGASQWELNQSSQESQRPFSNSAPTHTHTPYHRNHRSPTRSHHDRIQHSATFKHHSVVTSIPPKKKATLACTA